MTSTPNAYVLDDPEAARLRAAACPGLLDSTLDIVTFDPGARILLVGPGTYGMQDALGSEAVVTVAPIDEAVLPFDADAFDVALSAHWLPRFADASSQEALRELHRVVRPAGTVVVAEWDSTLFRLVPAPPWFVWHFFDLACEQGPIHHLARSMILRRFMERAGFERVVQRTVFSDHWAPLKRTQIAWLQRLFAWMAAAANLRALPSEEAAFWSELGSGGEPMTNPEFFCGEAEAVSVGVVPEH